MKVQRGSEFFEAKLRKAPASRGSEWWAALATLAGEWATLQRLPTFHIFSSLFIPLYGVYPQLPGNSPESGMASGQKLPSCSMLTGQPACAARVGAGDLSWIRLPLTHEPPGQGLRLLKEEFYHPNFTIFNGKQ